MTPVAIRGTLATLMLSAATLPCAHAGISSEVRVDDFQITLIDLDVNDGITPGFAFVDDGSDDTSFVITSFTYREGSEPVTERQVGTTDFPIQTITRATQTDHGSVSATLENKGSGAYGFLLSGTASASLPVFESHYEGYAGLNDSWMPRSFTLTPQTAVIFSGTASVSATAIAPAPGETGSAGASFYMTIEQWESGFTSTVDDDSIYADVRFSSCCTPVYTDQSSRLLSVRFDNTGSSSAERLFRASANAVGTHTASAVPEPAHAFMVLAGGLGLALTRRRRTRG
jgi:hypothetical protein